VNKEELLEEIEEFIQNNPDEREDFCNKLHSIIDKKPEISEKLKNRDGIENDTIGLVEGLANNSPANKTIKKTPELGNLKIVLSIEK
jgi:hypothetical protein